MAHNACAQCSLNAKRNDETNRIDVIRKLCTKQKKRQPNMAFVDFLLLLHHLDVRTRCRKMPIHVTTSYRCVYLNTIKIAVDSVDFQLILVEQCLLPNVHVLSYKMWMAIEYTLYMYNKEWQHVVIETIFSVLLWIPIVCDAIQKKM